tara:strand:- start:1051 stop:2085 length:1035 start_codon:yes stop_codon:yes gene_type:complete
METNDDRRYRLAMERKRQVAAMDAETQRKIDVDNEALESGDVSPEVEAELTRSQAEKDMDDSMRKAHPLNKGGMLNDPLKVKYNEGSSVQGKKDLAKILEAGEDGADKAIVEIMKHIPGSEGPPKGLVSLLEPILRKAGEAYRAHKKEAEGSAETKVAKNMGGSMLVPPEMGLEDEMPVDTYDNIPEDEKEAAEASQLPDDEMEEDYTGYVLEQSLDVEEQEYLMSVLENDERLSGIFDKVMDVAGEFSGEGEVEGLGTGVSDSIPARLSDGEFVFTKKATDQMGADQLQTMMDEAEMAYDGGLMKKAFGGIAKAEDTLATDDSKVEDEINTMMVDSNRMPSVR